MSRLVLSKGTLFWICKRIREASENRGKTFKTLRNPTKQGERRYGVRNLKLQNNSLLKKWLWRYNEEGQTLWKDVIQQIYGRMDIGALMQSQTL